MMRVDQSDKKAVNFLQKAASKGHVKAQETLAKLMNQVKAKQDREKSARSVSPRTARRASARESSARKSRQSISLERLDLEEFPEGEGTPL